MAKSSINFQRVSTHSFKHNDRSEAKKAKTVFAEYSHLNECNISAKEAKQKFDDLYKNAMSKITGRTRRAKKENTLVEAVVNLNSEHTLKDVQQLVKKIEQETGFTTLQIAIHKDEGQEQDGKLVRKNHHAHISFFTLDLQTGRQMFRREHLTREKLSKLQDITAKTLQMQRGQKNSKRKRLNHKEYKAVKQAELAKQKDLKEQIKTLREQLKQRGAVREDYAKLEQLNRELKAQIKAKELTNEQLEQKLAEYTAEKKQFKELDEETVRNLVLEKTFFKNKISEEGIKKIVTYANQAIKQANAKILKDTKRLEAQISSLEAQNQTLSDENRKKDKYIAELKKELSEAKEEISRLKAEIIDLKYELKQRSNMRERQATRKELNEKQKELNDKKLISKEALKRILEQQEETRKERELLRAQREKILKEREQTTKKRSFQRSR